MKKLLVLAAGILQVPVIRKAKDLGFYVIAADGNPDAVGLHMADKAVVANITSEDEMLCIAVQENIDGVIHPCSEVSMNVMGRINDEMHLHGISKEVAIRATNKHQMRKAFEEYGAPSPKSYVTVSADAAWDVFCEIFVTDAILKPSRNSGSRGIAKVTRGIDKASFIKLYERAYKESRDYSVLIEEFIEGPEFSVEIIIWNGVPHILAVTDKLTTGAPYFVELGHNQPSVYPKDIVISLKEAAIKGVKALGLDYCAAHAELKIQNGKAYLMEIGARLGGDFISTELVHLSTGIDMVAAAVNVSLGIQPDLVPKENQKGACIRYFTPDSGKLTGIENTDILNDPHVYAADIYVKEGDDIPEVKSSLDRSGHVIVTEESAESAIAFADNIIDSIKFNISSR